MPIISKVENSDFDVSKIGDPFADNNGTEITTEGILEGWEGVKEEIEKSGVIDKLKKSPYYIQKKS